MCTHQKKIFNRYAKQWLYVNCGQCPACLQEKANRRANRIRNHAQSNGLLGVFVTLTYDNKYIPYIRKDEIEFGKSINVYRDYDVRKVNCKKHSNGSFGVVLRDAPCVAPIDSVDLVFERPSQIKFMQPATFDANKLPSLHSFKNHQHVFDKDKCSVALYSDFQKFYKRLRINYNRYYGKEFESSFYACTEYGETYRRAHIHALLFCKPEIFTSFADCIRSSWPYSTDHVDVQVARNCASYVASYVNCGSNFPRLLKQFFRPKCAYSRNFGLDSRAFQLDAILSKIKSGDMRYLATRTLDGRVTPCSLPIPFYVLHRWFPKCKGYSRLSPDEAFRIVLSPKDTLDRRAMEFGISPTEIRQYATRLRNCFGRFRAFHLSRGKDTTIFDYAIAHAGCWRAFYSTLIKSSYDNFDANNFGGDYYHYINISDYYDGKIRAELPPLPSPEKRLYSPNDFPTTVVSTAHLSDLYRRKLKQAKVTNYVMTQMSYDV